MTGCKHCGANNGFEDPVTVTIWMERDMKERLQRYTKEDGMTVSGKIRKLVQGYLNSEE